MADNAPRDDNYVAVILAVSMIDLATTSLVAVNPLTGAVIVEIG